MSTTVLAVAMACSGDGFGEDDDIDAVMMVVATAMAMVRRGGILSGKRGWGREPTRRVSVSTRGAKRKARREEEAPERRDARYTKCEVQATRCKGEGGEG